MISLGNQPNSGLIVVPDTFSETHDDLIVSLMGDTVCLLSTQSVVSR